MTLDEARARIGDKVIYTAHGLTEEGVITSVSPRWVYVKYPVREGSGSLATDPADLTFLAEGVSDAR